METGFESLGQREMAGQGMVTLLASMDWAAHFFLAGRARHKGSSAIKAEHSWAGRGPLQGWVLLPKCRHLLGSGVGEGVYLSGNDRDREKGFLEMSGRRDKPDV